MGPAYSVLININMTMVPLCWTACGCRSLFNLIRVPLAFLDLVRPRPALRALLHLCH